MLKWSRILVLLLVCSLAVAAENVSGPETKGTISLSHGEQALVELAQQSACLSSAKKYSQAERKLLELLDRRRKAVHPDMAAIAADLNSLGELCNLQDRTAEAELRFHCAMESAKQNLEPSSPLRLKILLNQAETYFREHNFAESEAAYRQLLEIEERRGRLRLTNQIAILSALGRICVLDQRFRQAELLFVRALDTMEATGTFPRAQLSQDLHDLNEIYVKQGRRADLIKLKARALKCQRAANAAAAGTKR